MGSEDKRNKVISCRVTDDEYAAFVAEARAGALYPAELARERLLRSRDVNAGLPAGQTRGQAEPPKPAAPAPVAPPAREALPVHRVCDIGPDPLRADNGALAK